MFDCWDRPPYPSQRAHDRTANELFERLAAALANVEVESGAARLATGLDAFFSFVEERRDAWRILFRDVADPETAAVLDRILEQVTGVVAALIAQDPGVRRVDQDDPQGERWTPPGA